MGLNLMCSVPPAAFMCSSSGNNDQSEAVADQQVQDDSIIVATSDEILNRSMEYLSVSAGSTTTTGTTPVLVESSWSETSASSNRVRLASIEKELANSIVSPDDSHNHHNHTNNHNGAAAPVIVKPGETSPSSLLLQRKLSTRIVTNPTKNHSELDGRPVVVPQDDAAGDVISSSFTGTINKNHATSSSRSDDITTSPRIIPQPTLIKAPRSGPARPSHVKDRCVSAAAALSSSLSSSFSSTTGLGPPPLETGEVASSSSTAAASKDGRSSNKRPDRPQLHRCSSEHVKYNVSQMFILHPPPLRLEIWSEPAAEAFNVRSKRYLEDKVKTSSQASAFSLLAVDLVQVPKGQKPIYGGLCAHPNERVQQALKRERERGIPELPPLVFAVNLVVPGQVIYHSVYYFGCDATTLEEIRQATTPFGKLMHRFLYAPTDSASENDFRNNSFKLIPRIVEGNFMVRKAVGSKPAVLGKKIAMTYVRDSGPDTRFFEVMVDIASDSVAQRIVKLALGYTKTMTVDMAFCLEGHHPATLPERIFGAVRLKNIDFKDKDGKRVVSPP